MESLQEKVTHQTELLSKVLKVIEEIDYKNRAEVSESWPCNSGREYDEFDDYMMRLNNMKDSIAKAIR
mgnify:CR=1 FL=1